MTDLIVIPVDMDRRAVKGIDDLLKVTSEVKRCEQEDIVYTLVKTKVNKSHSKMLQATNNNIASAGYKVANSEIRVSELYKQATENKRPSVIHAKGDRPYFDYMELTNEILETLGA